MGGASLHLRQYARPLGSGARNARRRWTERHGLFLEIHLENGTFGVGEAAPLPGYSPDALDQARDVLGALQVKNLELDGLLKADGKDLLEATRRRLELVPGSVPSARFALETALLDLVGKRLGLPLPALLAGDPEVRWTLPETAPLVTGETPIEDLPDRGAIKVKVGRAGAFEEEVAFLVRIRRARPDLELRLDANGAWTRDEAPRYLERLVPLAIRWIEEPVTPDGLESLVELVERSPVPVALDESLFRFSLVEKCLVEKCLAPAEKWVEKCLAPAEKCLAPAEKCLAPAAERCQVPSQNSQDPAQDFLLSSQNLLDSSQIGMAPAAVILKPQVLGGALACLTLAQAAHEAGAAAVASHAFDGPVAYRATVALGTALDRNRRTAHGLAPHDGLRAWPQELQALPSPDAPGLGFSEPLPR